MKAAFSLLALAASVFAENVAILDERNDVTQTLTTYYTTTVCPITSTKTEAGS